MSSPGSPNPPPKPPTVDAHCVRYGWGKAPEMPKSQYSFVPPPKTSTTKAAVKKDEVDKEVVEKRLEEERIHQEKALEEQRAKAATPVAIDSGTGAGDAKILQTQTQLTVPSEEDVDLEADTAVEQALEPSKQDEDEATPGQKRKASRCLIFLAPLVVLAAVAVPLGVILGSKPEEPANNVVGALIGVEGENHTEVPSMSPSAAPPKHGPFVLNRPEWPMLGFEEESTREPSVSTQSIFAAPTQSPSKSPSLSPTTRNPSSSPSSAPTTAQPTTMSPTPAPQPGPTPSPTMKPVSSSPTAKPTTQSPSKSPSLSPTTRKPSGSPSSAPTTKSPSKRPSLTPSTAETSRSPTASPSTKSPSKSPSLRPTEDPTTPPPTPPPTLPQMTKTDVVDEFNAEVSNQCFGMEDRTTSDAGLTHTISQGRCCNLLVQELTVDDAKAAASPLIRPAMEGSASHSMGLDFSDVGITCKYEWTVEGKMFGFIPVKASGDLTVSLKDTSDVDLDVEFHFPSGSNNGPDAVNVTTCDAYVDFDLDLHVDNVPSWLNNFLEGPMNILSDLIEDPLMKALCEDAFSSDGELGIILIDLYPTLAMWAGTGSML